LSYRIDHFPSSIERIQVSIQAIQFDLHNYKDWRALLLEYFSVGNSYVFKPVSVAFHVIAFFIFKYANRTMELHKIGFQSIIRIEDAIPCSKKLLTKNNEFQRETSDQFRSSEVLHPEQERTERILDGML
jgi:hypothetical protein